MTSTPRAENNIGRRNDPWAQAGEARGDTGCGDKGDVATSLGTALRMYRRYGRRRRVAAIHAGPLGGVPGGRIGDRPPWPGRLSCHSMMRRGCQTWVRPIVRSGAGIWPRARYDDTVPTVTPR